ncbi:MAG: family 78 glycoside hydrolase catalytic domain [Lachnotalea sp.]
MNIYDLKVNHLSNPLGYRMEHTVFSWKVKDAKGKTQTEARIQIASKEDMTDAIFDSGWDDQADSLGYLVELKLTSSTRYFWRVIVRTDAGEEEHSKVQWFETAKLAEPWIGKWISCDSAKKRHPFFEKKVLPKKPVKQARLYICGLGLYEAYLGGEKIGTEYLTPYSNDYKEWVQYQTYDITQQLEKSGTLSILLGNGWFKSRFGFSAIEDIGFYGSEWKLIAEVKLFYTDGTQEIIGTDESWTVRRSNILFSNIYDGEQRDDTLPELPIVNAIYCESPKGELTARMSTPVTVHETFQPIELLYTPAGEQVFDMGQEFAGIFKLRVKEPAGTKIHIQTGEVLQGGNFYNENLRTAKSEYIYISDGTEVEIIPHFTYYGYRFVKIEGISDLKKVDFTGLALYSEISQTGNISTGHGLVNQLVSNVRWGLKSNFVDVPTDCPQRDERMGWTGDAQVFTPTATYLEDTYAFYAKYLYDMAKEQKALGGKVPDVVPSCGVETCATVWGDAACIIPWSLYEFYGDKSILKEQFESMKSWVDYIHSVDGEDHKWREQFHYGDWLALDNTNGGVDQVLGGTDEEFIANVYYAVSAGIVAKAAGVLGLTEEEKKYAKLSKEQFDIVKTEYYSPSGRCCIKTQTALLLTLKYHLSDNEILTKKMLYKLFTDNNFKLKTGFVGTPLMCNILSDNGFDDLSYQLLLNEEYPGWLHEIKLGATTVWERWNSVTEDGSISSTGMNSLNHYSYGSIVEWMFRHAAGLNPTVDIPGFREATIIPTLNWKIGHVEASYDSAAGLYKSAWKLIDPTHVELMVTVPFGCRASLTLPLANPETYGDNTNPMFIQVQEGVCYLTAGEYQVVYETTQSIKPIYDTTTPLIVLLQNPELKEKLYRIIMQINALSTQYLSNSIREITEKFKGSIDEEEMNKLDQMIKAYY